MNKGTVLTCIETNKKKFTKSEQKLADYVVSTPEEVIYCSTNMLAEKARVGDGTVNRFCKKLGFKGYLGFKMELAQELAGISQSRRPLQEISSVLDEGDSAATVLNKMYEGSVKTLQDTATLLTECDLEHVAARFVSARKILFYGCGMSAVSAAEAKIKFLRIGYPVDCYSDGHLMLMSAALTTPEDVVVGISFSGSSIDIVDALKEAQARGAYTVAITRYPKSPVTVYSERVRVHGGREAPLQGGELGSKLAQLFTLDLIYNLVLVGDRERAVQNKRLTSNAIKGKVL